MTLLLSVIRNLRNRIKHQLLSSNPVCQQQQARRIKTV